MRYSRVLPLLLGAMLGLTSCVPAFVPPGTTTTFILVRHAERDPGLDPPLNEEGMIRAEALLNVLRENGVTAIYCTDLLRNRATVQPLADELGLTLNVINPALYINTPSAADLVVNQMLANDAGGTVLWCGNIGSTAGTTGINEEIYKRLGGTGTSPDRYRDLYVMVVPAGMPPHVVKARYGRRSSLDP